MNLQTSLPSGKPKTWKARYTVLTLIWLAWLLSFLDRMVMSVSLPYIGKDLNLDTTQQGLIISAFLLVMPRFKFPVDYWRINLARAKSWPLVLHGGLCSPA